MEQLISKITEIETSAVAILENTNTIKEDMSLVMEQKIAAFDEELNQKTEKTLSEVIAKCNLAQETELIDLKAKTEKQLLALEQEYASNHETLAKQILSSMIGE